MSQNKTNREKITKKDRLQAYQKAKRNLMIQNTIIVAVVLGVFGFFGYSVTTGMMDRHTESHYISTNVLSEYMTGLTDDSADTTVESTVEESNVEEAE